MKKLGFTLAEVLITLSIVGVVAALTAPSLIMSSRNEANAAKLAVSVSNIENAMQSLMSKEGAENLYQTSLWDSSLFGKNGSDDSEYMVISGDTNNGSKIAEFVGRLGQYLLINGYKNSSDAFYGTAKVCGMTATGATSTNCYTGNNSRFDGFGNPVALTLKNGATMFIRTYHHSQDDIDTGKATAIDSGTSYYTNAADVFIDVNGKNAPNTYGRDIFWFEMGENGVLYPVGGKDVDTASGEWTVGDKKNRHGVWDVGGTQASCTDNDKGNVAKNAGIGCTARVIDEGYKINY